VLADIRVGSRILLAKTAAVRSATGLAENIVRRPLFRFRRTPCGLSCDQQNGRAP
jgi:hypothetical protein